MVRDMRKHIKQPKSSIEDILDDFSSRADRRMIFTARIDLNSADDANRGSLPCASGPSPEAPHVRVRRNSMIARARPIRQPSLDGTTHFDQRPYTPSSVSSQPKFVVTIGSVGLTLRLTVWIEFKIGLPAGKLLGNVLWLSNRVLLPAPPLIVTCSMNRSCRHPHYVRAAARADRHGAKESGPVDHRDVVIPGSGRDGEGAVEVAVVAQDGNVIAPFARS